MTLRIPSAATGDCAARIIARATAQIEDRIIGNFLSFGAGDTYPFNVAAASSPRSIRPERTRAGRAVVVGLGSAHHSQPPPVVGRNDTTSVSANPLHDGIGCARD